MKRLSIIKKIKLFIGNIGWRLFLWGTDITENEYWSQVYEQEKIYREQFNDYED
jgi:hypothetical protein